MRQSIRIAALAIASLMALFVVACGESPEPNPNQARSGLTSSDGADAGSGKTPEEADSDDAKDPGTRHDDSALHSNDPTNAKDPLKSN